MQIHIYLLKRDNNVTFLIKIVFSYKKISNKKLFIILLLLPWQMLNLALYINHFHEKKVNCIYIGYSGHSLYSIRICICLRRRIDWPVHIAQKNMAKVY